MGRLPFVHLHVHSYYSFLEALPSPGELARAAAAQGMAALALTDHLNLTGGVEFYLACQAAGLRPILGLEVDVALPAELGFAPPGPLVLLAMDLKGWSSLCGLCSALWMSASPVGSLEQISNYAEGVLCLSGGRRGLAGRLLAARQPNAAAALLAELRAAFPERLYVELHVPSPEENQPAVALAALARQLKLPVVAAQDSYYLTPQEAALQRTLAAIRLNRPLNDLPREAAAPPGSAFSSVEEMSARFAGLPEALAATQEVAGRCRLELPIGQTHFPTVPLPPGLSAAEFLRQKAEAGAKRLYGGVTPAIRQRLDGELEVIAARGFEPIFLIMQEILDYARRAGVVFSSRGSAASSLVAHCLGVTSPDPLGLDLYFERFLNPARATPPDIDTDINSSRRDGVIRHVFEQYGPQRVAMVGTINRFRPRSALGEVAKAHGLSPGEVRQLVERLPRFYRHGAMTEEGQPTGNSPYAELESAFPGARYRPIFHQARALLGLPDHLSVHAGGLVVAPGRITDLAPVQRSGAKGVTITQMDLESVGRLGLVKIDLLGIRGLTVLGNVATRIHSWQRSEYAAPLDVLESIPLEDAQVSETLENGRTIGCFQIESPGMRATLREIRARSLEDLMVALALYRPGPLNGGLKDAFVRRHKGEEAVEHLHPALAPLLKDTYGVILYQEQVLRIAHDLAGLSLAEADLLRRAMSHFDPGQQMQTLKEHFIEGARLKSGVPPETAERVWELMAAFAGYGFPKAHAASYALVAWRSAWCKTHYPAEFMAAVLANWGGYYSQRVYLTEARRSGLRIHPPHIDHSQPEFSAAYPGGEAVLYMGLDQVRDLTRRTQERILRQRPFHSLEDFLARADPRPKEAENLIRVGALEGHGTIPALLRRLSRGATWQPGQPSLFAWEEDTQEEDWTLAQKLAAQEELLGASVDAHPLELYEQEIQAAGALTTVEAAGRVGQRVRVAGVRQSMHRSRTARGETMAFLSLEDLDGMLDVVLFPGVYRQARSALASPAPMVVEGTLELDPSRGEPTLTAERVWSLGKAA